MIRRPFGIVFACSVIFVLYLGTTTDGRMSGVTSTHDKIAHTLVFFVETMLFTLLFKEKRIYIKDVSLMHLNWMRCRNVDGNLDNANSVSFSKYKVSFVICCLIASVCSEFIQALVTGGKRRFDFYDIVCNFSGSTLGLALVYRLEM